jgi:hypothetical protein
VRGNHFPFLVFYFSNTPSVPRTIFLLVYALRVLVELFEPEARFLQPALVVQVLIFLIERSKNQGIGLRFPSVLMLCIIAKSKPFSTHDLKRRTNLV